jgi:hypothetical protein
MRGQVPISGFKALALSGNALLTIESKASGRWFTYRVRAKGSGWYVYQLMGPDNHRDYLFIGTILHGCFFPSRKICLGLGAKGFAWAWRVSGTVLDRQATLYHEGRCCRCGRLLTVPESIASGLGPECRKR